MGQKVTTVDQQIKQLKDRGMTINDAEYAKRKLLDLGYYHLGFYWHPFEKDHDTHEFKDGVRFEDVIHLYEFEFKLKHLLMKYVRRIEVNLRTQIIYHISNAYPDKPTWFVDPTVVDNRQIKYFSQNIYSKTIMQYSVIKHHHQHYINDKYAPAWKTLEYITLGALVSLFSALKSRKDQEQVSNIYGILSLKTFKTYLSAIWNIRNYCAHSNVLFDMSLQESIRKGPAGDMKTSGRQELSGALLVIYYMVGQIDNELQLEFRNDFTSLFQEYVVHSGISCIVKKIIDGKEINDFFC